MHSDYLILIIIEVRVYWYGVFRWRFFNSCRGCRKMEYMTEHTGALVGDHESATDSRLLGLERRFEHVASATFTNLRWVTGHAFLAFSFHSIPYRFLKKIRFEGEYI